MEDASRDNFIDSVDIKLKRHAPPESSSLNTVPVIPDMLTNTYVGELSQFAIANDLAVCLHLETL